VRAILEGRKTQTRRVVKPVRGYEHNNICRPDMMRDAHIVWWHGEFETVGCSQECPYGVPGDRLWVRESFTYWEQPDRDDNPRRNESPRPADGKRYERWMNRIMSDETSSGEDFLMYRADEAKRSLGEWTYPHEIYEHCIGKFGKTIPGIHMPRWASRLTLEVTDVRVQRVQEISEEDAIAEGVDLERYVQVSDSAGIHACGTAEPTEPRSEFRDLWESINHKRSPWERNDWVWALTFKRIEP